MRQEIGFPVVLLDLVHLLLGQIDNHLPGCCCEDDGDVRILSAAVGKSLAESAVLVENLTCLLN